MLPQLIPLTICSVVALGAALVAVVRRDALQSTVFLATMCLGVAGLFLLLEAPAIAALQLLLAAGLIFLIRLAPRIVHEMARANPGLGRRRWQAAWIVAALCGVFVGVVIRYGAGDLTSGSLSLAALLFCIGLYAVLARRDMVGVLMGVIAMLNGIAVNLVAFSGQLFAAAIYAVLVTQVTAGLVFGAALWRSRGTATLDEADWLKE
jgi:NADH-quinone oxidoreductase subunit K